VVLPGDRLLHLEHEVGDAPDLVRVRDDRRARRDVNVVAERGAGARVLLQVDLVAVADQLAGAGRRDRDSVFVVLDLAGNADLHD